MAKSVIIVVCVIERMGFFIRWIMVEMFIGSDGGPTNGT